MSIERVGVIGAGQMGSGIAEVSARAGAEVVVYEPTDELITAGSKRITASLERMVSKGKLAESDRDATLARLTFTTDLSDLWDRQLVIEAVVEDEAVKERSSPLSTRSSPIPTRCWRRTPPASRS